MFSGGTLEQANVIVVVATPFGKWDLRKFVDDGKKQLILDYIEYLFEVVHLAQKTRSSPSRVHIQAVLILDYEGFSLRQMASRESNGCLLSPNNAML